MKGDTAEDLSRSFGKVDHPTYSLMQSDTNDQLTLDFELRDLLPPDKIEALSQGSFCGYVADTYKQKIHPKIFCGEVDAGAPPKSQESVPRLTDLTDEQMNTLVERNYQKIRQDVADFLQFELNNPDV